MNTRRIVGMIACCLLFVGITKGALAQCGGPASVQILCCGEKIQVFNYFALNNGNAVQFKAACPNGMSCGSYPSAAGSCVQVSLSTPEMINRLNKMSQRAPLLVASCTGGLVRYQPLPVNAFDINSIGRERLLPIRDVKRGGE